MVGMGCGIGYIGVVVAVGIRVSGLSWWFLNLNERRESGSIWTLQVIIYTRMKDFHPALDTQLK